MKKIFLFLLTMCAFIGSVSAQATGVAMADRLREDGKIWVVVAVVAVIFTGLISYLIRIDSKLSKIEKDLKIK